MTTFTFKVCHGSPQPPFSWFVCINAHLAVTSISLLPIFSSTATSASLSSPTIESDSLISFDIAITIFGETTSMIFTCCPTFFHNEFQITIRRLIYTIELSTTFSKFYLKFPTGFIVVFFSSDLWFAAIIVLSVRSAPTFLFTFAGTLIVSVVLNIKFYLIFDFKLKLLSIG